MMRQNSLRTLRRNEPLASEPQLELAAAERDSAGADA